MLFYQSQFCYFATLQYKIMINDDDIELPNIKLSLLVDSIDDNKKMELELGLKLTRVADEFSSADFLLSKDRAGPLFISTESDALFILTAHLKGYKKQDIEIEINEDGTRIIIRGEKLVQETLMLGWKLQKKEALKREFKKAFKIPDGVILDKIKAKFDDDECKLTIWIPKKEKGIRGVRIDEVNEPEIARQGSETLQIVPDEFPEEQDLQPEEHEEKEKESGQEENSAKVSEMVDAQKTKETGSDVPTPQETQIVDQKDQNDTLQKVSSGHELIKLDSTEKMKKIANEVSGEETETPNVGDQDAMEESVKYETGTQEEMSQSSEEKLQGENDECPLLEQEMDKNQHNNHDVNEDNVEEVDKEDEYAYCRPSYEAQPPGGMPSITRDERGGFRLCTPILAGSALLLSLVAFVVHHMRTKSQPGKRRD